MPRGIRKGVASRVIKKNTRKITKRATNTKLEIEIPKKKKEKKKLKMDFLTRPNYARDYVPESKAFYTVDGAKLYNLMQLAEYIENAL